MVAQIEGVIWNGRQWIRVKGQEFYLANGDGSSRGYFVGRNRTIDSFMPIGIDFIRTSMKNTVVKVSPYFNVTIDPPDVVSGANNEVRLMNGQTAVFSEKSEKVVGIAGIRIRQKAR